MSNQIASATGFTSVSSKNTYEEVVSKVVSPTEATIRPELSYSTKRDLQLRNLIKKSGSAYNIDGLIRQAVDKYAENFKAFSFEGDPKCVKYLEDRLNTMSLHTGEYWKTFLTRLITEYFKTGNAFVVKLRGGLEKSGFRPLYSNRPYSLSGFSLISADRLDVAADPEGSFLGWKFAVGTQEKKLDLVLPGAQRLNPASALITVPNPPSEVKERVFLSGPDVVQIAYKKGADSNWGVGLTLPSLEDIALLRTMEQTTAIMSKKFANPIIHHKIIRSASPQAGIQSEIDQAYVLHRRADPTGVIITGGNSEIKAVGAESQALRLEGYLRYFLDRAFSGLGVSQAVMGIGSMSIGAAQAGQEILMTKVRFCQEELSREIEFFILNEILWEGKFDPYTNPAHKVKLVFEDIDQDALIKLQTHAAQQFNMNMMDHGEARSFGKLKKKPVESELYLNKIKKAELDHETKGKVQQIKAKPSAKEVRQYVPTSDEHIDDFLFLIKQRMGIDLSEYRDNIEELLGDEEAIVALVMENADVTIRQD